MFNSQKQGGMIIGGDPINNNSLGSQPGQNAPSVIGGDEGIGS